MYFKIHCGANKIGGSCVEVWTTITRIAIDKGIHLVNADKTPFDAKEIEKLSNGELLQKGILPDIPSLYEENSNTTVLISHPYQDHYGLLSRIHPSR